MRLRILIRMKPPPTAGANPVTASISYLIQSQFRPAASGWMYGNIYEA